MSKSGGYLPQPALCSDVLTWPCDFSCSAEEHGLFILLSQMFLALFGAKDIVERQQQLLLCVPCCSSALKAFAIM